MLRESEIVTLRIQRDSVDRHARIEVPSFVTNAAIAKFAALNTAILSRVLGLDPGRLEAQISGAREEGADFICKDRDDRRIGISVATSLIKVGSITSKHVIVPHDFVSTGAGLDDKIIVGAFCTGRKTDDDFLYDSEVKLAGWTDLQGIHSAATTPRPPLFKTKLNVLTVPCRELQPMRTLANRLEDLTIKL